MPKTNERDEKGVTQTCGTLGACIVIECGLTLIPTQNMSIAKPLFYPFTIRRIAALILSLSAVPFLHAQTTLEIPASDNAFVLRSSSGTLQDASQSLLTKRLNDSNTRVAYLRFDLSPFFNA
jgi:hypothetical protein